MKAAGLTCVPWIGAKETLYSYCVFVHRFNRWPSSAASARLMLCAAHATRQHDLPSALGALTKFAEPAFADPADALLRHTVAGFYWPFLTEERRRSTMAALLAPAGCFGLRLLGASTRRLAVEHPLKWCPECLAADFQSMGRPCWRTRHQYPTSFVCDEHGVALRVSGVGGKTWRWPDEGPAKAGPQVSDVTSTLSAVGLAASSNRTIALETLRGSTIDRLADLGVLHSRRTVRHERLERWFGRTSVGRWLSMAPNGLETLKSGDWIAKMIWRRPTSHAVRWAVLWSALDWASPEEAAARFLAASCQGSCGGADELAPTAAIWPRPCAPVAFENAANECTSYAGIAKKLGASRSDVVRWFEAYPALRSQWRSRWLATRRRGDAHAPSGDEAIAKAVRAVRV